MHAKETWWCARAIVWSNWKNLFDYVYRVCLGARLMASLSLDSSRYLGFKSWLICTWKLQEHSHRTSMPKRQEGTCTCVPWQQPKHARRESSLDKIHAGQILALHDCQLQNSSALRISHRIWIRRNILGLYVWFAESLPLQLFGRLFLRIKSWNRHLKLTRCLSIFFMFLTSAISASCCLWLSNSSESLPSCQRSTLSSYRHVSLQAWHLKELLLGHTLCEQSLSWPCATPHKLPYSAQSKRETDCQNDAHSRWHSHRSRRLGNSTSSPTHLSSPHGHACAHTWQEYLNALVLLVLEVFRVALH